MEPVPPYSPLLFEGLTDHLRRLGLSVGIGHHLRLQHLLSRVCGQCSPEDLKSLICPLFAVNEKQQDAFYSAFDSFLPLLSFQAQTPAPSHTLPGQKHREAVPTRQWAPPKWACILASIVLLALLIGVAEWKSHIVPPPSTPAARTDTSAPPAAVLPSSEVEGRKVAKEGVQPRETATTPPEPSK